MQQSTICSLLFSVMIFNVQLYASDMGTLQQRPPAVQNAIDRSFEMVKGARASEWQFDGSQYSYSLLDLNDKKLIKDVVIHSEARDVYVLDVGCGRGRWGRSAFRVLSEDPDYKQSEKLVHIFSITGGQECKERIKRQDSITLYQLNQLKIENIDQELKKKGFNLEKKVKLIVSHWTLRHLVDPFGTLTHLYDLLTPSQGMLLSNGFYFNVSNSEVICASPNGNCDPLSQSNATVLSRYYQSEGDVGQFMLMRNNNNKLNMPFEYEENIRSRVFYKQGNSDQSAIYKLNKALMERKRERTMIDAKREIYCDENNEASKQLYSHLTARNLFNPTIDWDAFDQE